MLWLSLMTQLMFAEWWAAEITILIAGRLHGDDDAANEVSLSSMAIYSQTNMLCGMILVGIFLAISTRVSNELGAARPLRARAAARTGIVVSSAIGVVVALALVLARRPISKTFTTDDQIIENVQALMIPMSIYQFMSFVCASLEGIVLGSGRQSAGAMRVIFSYFCVGLPVSYVFGYTMKMGVIGLSLGRVSGKAIQLLLYLLMYVRTDWDEEVERARKLLFSTSGKLPAPPEVDQCSDAPP